MIQHTELCLGTSKARPKVKRHCRHRSRRAVAALELTISLPLFCLLLMLMFTVTSIGMTYSSVSVRSRKDAWSGRHHPWRNRPEFERRSAGTAPPAELARILGDQVRVHPDTALVAEAQAKVPVFHRQFTGLFGDAHSVHTTMGGTWDFREIRFESKPEHPRLTPTRKVRFLPHTVSFDGFRNLASFASAEAIAILQQAQAAHTSTAAEMRRRVQRELDKVNAELQLWIARQESLERQLAALLAADPPDDAAIRQVRNELQQVIEQIARLQVAQQTLTTALAAMPG